MSLAHRPAPVKPAFSRWLVPLVCWLIGLALTFHPSFRSLFDHVPGWPSQDPRLVNFILEHRYRSFLPDDAAASSFWSPPVFFPKSGVTTYTEPLIAVPRYCPLSG